MIAHSVEHMLACIIEAATYDNAGADSVCVSISRETKTGRVKAGLIASGVSGNASESLQAAVQSLYDVYVEQVHKDCVRVEGLLKRLDAKSADTKGK